jgi:hypothetical protein
MKTTAAPLCPRLEKIRRAIAKDGDYSGLRDGGEELVRDYAQTIGLSAPELMWSWTREPESASHAKRTRVDVRPDRTVIVIDDDPADQQTEPDQEPDDEDEEREADDYSDDDIRDDPPPSKRKPGGKSSGDDCDPDDNPTCDD